MQWGHKVWLLASLLSAGTLAHAAVENAAAKSAKPAASAKIESPRSTPPAVPPKAPPEPPPRVALSKPDVRSASVLVFDENDASIVYAHKADIALPIASITKLMTAIVVLEAQLPLDEKIEITKADRNSEKGSFSRLAIGTKLSRGDMLHLALMSSENRAASALGRNYPGGLPAFIRAMNAKAKALGMTRAKFVDPTGLSSGNVASSHDLSKLVLAAASNPTIAEFSTDKHFAVAVGKRMLEFHNTNTLVSNPSWDIAVQKTGYISEAGQCLVMKAAIQGRSIVIVLLNSFGKYTRVADAKRIRKWMEASEVAVARAQ
jgi:serine-type D-Ala-D-Ala endopeptidase (penicillin-binding protein 7)